jgi:hypothetical protein
MLHPVTNLALGSQELDVIPAKAGTSVCDAAKKTEVPAFAGMTRWARYP